MNKVFLSHGVRLFAIALLSCLLAAAFPAAVHGAGVTISNFYPATNAAYVAWNNTSSTAPPPRTDHFPSGTSIVAMYIDAKHAVAGTTQYVIVLRNQAGATVLTHGPYTFKYADTLVMSKLPAPNGSYPDGAYHADLKVNGQVVAGVNFTVGAVTSVKILTFYPATKAARDAWAASNTAPAPKQTTVFPHGTTIVSFYYQYKGAQAKTTKFTIVIRTQAGAPVVTFGPDTFAYNSADAMRFVTAPNGAYPDGAYRAELVTGGVVVAKTAFTVSSPTPSIKLLAFYTATKAAADAWLSAKTAYDPPRSNVFPAGTMSVAFFFHYHNARAKISKFSIVVHGPSGATFLTYGPYTLTYANGYYMDKVAAPSGGAYPQGAYGADLIVDGATVGHAAFTVSAASSTAVDTFYPATKAAYDAWNASNTAPPPPPSTTFLGGTNAVAFYFAFRGAKANVTQFEIVVRDHTGAVFTTHGPYTLSLGAGLHMSLVDAPANHTYPQGSYRGDLLVDGKVVKSASFAVAAAGVSVTSFYAASKQVYDAWNGAASPAQSTAFPTGTAAVAFYLQFNGATANKTQVKVVIHDHTGGVFATAGPLTLPASTGGRMAEATAPFGMPYPAGAYRAELLVDNKTVGSTFFSVGKQQTAQACSSSDVVATCIEPSILRLHANLANNMEAEGTGFVVQSDSSGTYLLTNKHVIDGATPSNMVALSPDGHTQYHVLGIQATTAAEGTAGDLAVVKLPPSTLRPLTWGDSTHLHLLQRVYSIGYGDAFDLPGPPSVTEGSISALGRDMGDGYGPVWIQHQSFINHGNSGGPLLDEQYHVIGVNTLSPKGTQGIFLAIPASLAQPTARQLIAKLSS